MMQVAAYIVLAFTGLQLLVALANLIFRKKMRCAENQEKLISVLIPARDEEANIAEMLSKLQKQDYRNIEVIVFNDQSTDDTARIVEDFSKTDQRIKLLNSNGLENGWLGKNFACHKLSQHAQGNFFLFMDADVRVDNDIINRSVTYAIEHKLGLLSIFPVQVLRTWGEWLTVPVMNFILLTLLPLVLVRQSRFISLSAANGQFMLFDAAVYKKLLPHREMRDRKVEDIEIARFLKRKKTKIACITSDTDVSCRMYNDFGSAVNGFSKNVLSFFGESMVLAVIFWLITTFGFILVVALGITKFAVYLLLVLGLQIVVSIISHAPVAMHLLLFIPRQLVFGVIIYKAIWYKYTKQHQWKGRNIY